MPATVSPMEAPKREAAGGTALPPASKPLAMIRLNPQRNARDRELMTYFEETRRFQIHEDNLIDKRTSWPLAAQAALIAFGPALIGCEGFPERYKGIALMGTAAIGFLVALATFMGVKGATKEQATQTRRFIGYAREFVRERLGARGETLPKRLEKDEHADEMLNLLPLPHVAGELGVWPKWGHWGNSFLGRLMPIVWIGLFAIAVYFHNDPSLINPAPKSAQGLKRPKPWERSGNG